MLVIRLLAASINRALVDRFPIGHHTQSKWCRRKDHKRKFTLMMVLVPVGMTLKSTQRVRSVDAAVICCPGAKTASVIVISVLATRRTAAIEVANVVKKASRPRLRYPFGSSTCKVWRFYARSLPKGHPAGPSRNFPFHNCKKRSLITTTNIIGTGVQHVAWSNHSEYFSRIPMYILPGDIWQQGAEAHPLWRGMEGWPSFLPCSPFCTRTLKSTTECSVETASQIHTGLQPH